MITISKIDYEKYDELRDGYVFTYTIVDGVDFEMKLDDNGHLLGFRTWGAPETEFFKVKIA